MKMLEFLFFYSSFKHIPPVNGKVDKDANMIFIMSQLIVDR